jgi:spermidine/putrescine transport system substrate-binding protein
MVLGVLAADAGLTSCAAPGLTPVPVGPAVADRSRSERVVRFANWPAYVDRAPGNNRVHPTLVEFTAQTGIAVDYSEPIKSDQEFFARLGIPFAMGRDTGYDLVILTDWLAAQIIDMGWAQELSPDLVPGAARVLPRFRDWPVPDARRYCLPWQGGFTGILYNARLTGRPVLGIMDLLTARDLHGRVTLASDMRDVIGLVMLELGIDPGDFSRAEFDTAIRTVARSVQAGQIAYVTDYALPPLTTGEIAASVGWAGDALYAEAQYPQIKFSWPARGGMLWTDIMLIPALARHRDNAERLMNFYYQPHVAAQLTNYERYLCPVDGTEGAMRALNPALVGQRFIFPPPELLREGHTFKILTPEQNSAFSQAYASAVGL